MSVVAFPDREQRKTVGWQAAELNQLVTSAAASLESGEASGWATGATEAGDPQFYLLGPPPDHECILCVSRLGRFYVLEDGMGRVLFEHDSVLALGNAAKAVLHDRKTKLIARLALIWFAIREAIEKKLEPLWGEGEELLAHFAPQFSALA